jgi:DNA-binding transcriptional regulator YiaG
VLGVNPQTVANWESKRGRLKLQERTLKTLTQTWLQR